MASFNFERNKGTVSDYIIYGTSHDVCTVCKRNLRIKEKMTDSSAHRKLEGEYVSQPLIKINCGYDTVIICSDCITTFYESIGNHFDNETIDSVCRDINSTEEQSNETVEEPENAKAKTTSNKGRRKQS